MNQMEKIIIYFTTDIESRYVFVCNIAPIYHNVA